jgi:hypothetical protein
MEKEGLTSDDIIANVSGRNDALEYGWRLALRYERARQKKLKNKVK